MSRTCNYVAVGDSITFGSGQGGSAYPLIASTALSLAEFHNIAIPGTYLDPSNMGGTADGLYNPARQVNVVSLMIGVNSQGDGAAGNFAKDKTWCLARRAAGYKIILCTNPAAGGTGGAGSWDEMRMAIRTLDLADPSFYDYLADMAVDPVMGPDAAALDSTLYVDQLHPTAYGHTLLAPYIQAGISFLTQISSGVSRARMQLGM